MKNNLLTLGTIKYYSEKRLKNHILKYYDYDADKFQFILAYEHVDDFTGIGSRSFFVMRSYDGSIYVAHCESYDNGNFLGTFEPECIELNQLFKNGFTFPTSDLDDNADDNIVLAYEHLTTVL